MGTTKSTRGRAPSKRLGVPIPFLERMLVSPIVPLNAKLAAIEGCRHELAEMDRWDLTQIDLDARLAEAARALKTRGRRARANIEQ